MRQERRPIDAQAQREALHILSVDAVGILEVFEYPMPNGEIAIDAPAGPGRSLLILCDSEGGALCTVNFDRSHRRARYSDARMLPDGFLREAIRAQELADDCHWRERPSSATNP